ncbi:MAG: hypothetical protein WCI67_16515 [Chloroflexales bacterium]
MSECCTTTTSESCGPRDARGPALIAPPFPTAARGRDQDGSRFVEDVTLDDLRAHSLLLRLGRSLRPGTALLIMIRIGAGQLVGAPAPAVAIRGRVVQSTPEPLGGYAVAISFDRYRFLSGPDRMQH